MNREGQYTDRHGRVLTVGARVRVLKEEGAVRGAGTIQSLPKENSDWYAYPYVALDDGGKHHVPDVSLQLLDTDDVAGHLERAITATRARNVALSELSTRLDVERGEG